MSASPRKLQSNSTKRGQSTELLAVRRQENSTPRKELSKMSKSTSLIMKSDSKPPRQQVFELYLEHCPNCALHQNDDDFDHEEDFYKDLIQEMMDSLEVAVDNDMIKRDNEYAKMKYDENGDEIQYETPLGPPPEKLRFRLVTNLKLPQAWGFFERVTVPRLTADNYKLSMPIPACSRPAHMIYERRTGKLAYFPRKYAFELTFLNDLIYSRLQIMAENKERIAKEATLSPQELQKLHLEPRKQEWPPKFEEIAQKLVDSAIKSLQGPKNSEQNQVQPKETAPIGNEAQTGPMTRSSENVVRIKLMKTNNQAVRKSLMEHRINPSNEQYGSPKPMTSQSVKRYLDIPGKGSSLNYKMPSQNNRSAMMNQETSFDARSQDSNIEKVVRSYSSSMSQVGNPYSKVKDKYQKYLQKVNSVNEQQYNQLTEHRKQYDRYIRLVNRPNLPPNFSRMVLSNIKEENTQQSEKQMHQRQNPRSYRVFKESQIIKQKQDVKVFQHKRHQQQSQSILQVKRASQTPATSFNVSTGRYEIDKVYSLQIPCSKQVFKKLSISNTLGMRCQFQCKSSHPFEVQIRPEDAVLEMGPLESIKITLKFVPIDTEGTRIYVVIVSAEGKKYLNMLLSVQYVKEAEEKLRPEISYQGVNLAVTQTE